MPETIRPGTHPICNLYHLDELDVPKSKDLRARFYSYHPKFDVFAILIDFDLDEDSFSLINAQHIIAQFAGFYKWTDMLNASDNEHELVSCSLITIIKLVPRKGVLYPRRGIR